MFILLLYIMNKINEDQITIGCQTGGCNAFTPDIEKKDIVLKSSIVPKPERVEEKKEKQQNDNTAWIDDPGILFKSTTWYKFVPTQGMSKNQILNTFMRFGVYYFIIMLCIRRSIFDFFILLITIALSLFLYNSNILSQYNNETSITDDINLDITIKTKPTEHNPFMNTLISEIGNNIPRPSAEDPLKKDVSSEIDHYFNQNLYKNANDIYDRNNSQFVYHTVPNTTNYGVAVGDKVLFANYLYNKPRPTCKENAAFCNNEYSGNPDFKNIAQRSKPLNPYEKTLVENNVINDLNHRV